MNRAGKDIINRLLDKSESRRLGSQSGASQVKQHKWFAKTNWGLLRNMTPPVSSMDRMIHFFFLRCSRIRKLTILPRDSFFFFCFRGIDINYYLFVHCLVVISVFLVLFFFAIVLMGGIGLI